MNKIEEHYKKLKEELSRLEDKESNLALLLTDFMHEMEEEHPNLLKNENERIADEIIQFLYLPHPQFVGKRDHEKWIAWLEKQGNLVKYYEDKLDKCACDNFNKDYKKTLEKQDKQKLTPIFRIGDTIIAKDGTCIEKEPFHIDRIEDDCYWDGENIILVCNQDEFEIFEQKPVDKTEPKFKVGDWIVSNEHPNCDNSLMRIVKVGLTNYLCRYYNGQTTYCREFIDKSYHLWSIQDAKDGDVLVHSSFMFDDFIFIYNTTSTLQTYCYYSSEKNRFITEDRGHYCPWNMQEVKPATKEQRDTLMKAMTDAGYFFDCDTKKLEKKLPKGEDYGIDGIYHAIRILKKTLGKVDGYQTDDGILEHKCAISAVEELTKNKDK